jgi:hypothetical protein
VLGRPVALEFGDEDLQFFLRPIAESEGMRFQQRAATQSEQKRPPDPNEGGHPVGEVKRGALSAI